MSEKDKELFDALGFCWDRQKIPTHIPKHPIKNVAFVFQRSMPEFVWDASMAEGNPFTFPEVKTVMDGFTVGGRKISDHEQVVSLIKSCKLLLELVKSGEFSFSKQVFCNIHNLVAFEEALEWGHFRGEGDEVNYTPSVPLGDQGKHHPIETNKGAAKLNAHFDKAVAKLNELDNSFEKALAFFLYGALQQFFFDGNKRSSRFMMNGVLMTDGIYAISIPANDVLAFNEKMVRFYKTKDASEMMEFLVDCHPEATKIRELNRVERGAGDRS